MNEQRNKFINSLITIFSMEKWWKISEKRLIYFSLIWSEMFILQLLEEKKNTIRIVQLNVNRSFKFKNDFSFFMHGECPLIMLLYYSKYFSKIQIFLTLKFPIKIKIFQEPPSFLDTPPINNPKNKEVFLAFPPKEIRQKTFLQLTWIFRNSRKSMNPFRLNQMMECEWEYWSNKF